MDIYLISSVRDSDGLSMEFLTVRITLFQGEVDADGNGHIDFEEFKLMMRRRAKHAEDSDEDMKEFFE